jgi:hypothetical protein
MALISIRRDPATGQVVFDPPTLQLGVNDFAVWANYDPQAAHQPTKQGQAADYWLDNSLPPFVDGQPAATSPALNLTGTAATPITYVDGLDSAVAPGTITFN